MSSSARPADHLGVFLWRGKVMNEYPSMPRQLVDGWRLSEPSHPPKQQVSLHYHDTDELVEVVEGKTLSSLQAK
jgi:hypothetical protein